MSKALHVLLQWSLDYADSGFDYVAWSIVHHKLLVNALLSSPFLSQIHIQMHENGFFSPHPMQM